MALDSWLGKVKTTISSRLDSVRSTMTHVTDNAVAAATRRKANVGILAFEIASLMSKILHLWRSLSDAHVARLRHESIALLGVRKIVSDDDAFLLGLACAELTESLRNVSESVSSLSRRCADPDLRRFERAFRQFADSGHDPQRWVMSWKEMESKAKKMDCYITSTTTLYKEMDELSEAEHGLRKLLLHYTGSGDKKNPTTTLTTSKITTVSDAQQKVFWEKQEVKSLKETSLWSRSLDSVTSLLARSTFTVLSRIKHVFGIPHESSSTLLSLLPRSLSVSASVHPSSESPDSSLPFASGPLVPSSKPQLGFLESNSAVIAPPPSTLGATGLALHYANLIIVLEKMIRFPRAIGADARDDLYNMLPASVRASLRWRLRGLGYAASDPGLAGEWKMALGRIMEWLAPMAHNTVRWQGERSFERRSASSPRTNVLLLQTLYFANREKAEAAIAELLVGLNYVWRFEMEMTAKTAAAAAAYLVVESSPP